jgi:hypothetical protein
MKDICSQSGKILSDFVTHNVFASVFAGFCHTIIFMSKSKTQSKSLGAPLKHNEPTVQVSYRLPQSIVELLDSMPGNKTEAIITCVNLYKAIHQT